METIYNLFIQNLQISSDHLPSEGVLVNLAKNYSELEHYIRAIKILDEVIKINDEEVNDLI